MSAIICERGLCVSSKLLVRDSRLLIGFSHKSAKVKLLLKQGHHLGHLDGSVVEHLPLAQVMISEPQDRVLQFAPFREAASPSPVISALVSVSLMNK